MVRATKIARLLIISGSLLLLAFTFTVLAAGRGVAVRVVTDDETFAGDPFYADLQGWTLRDNANHVFTFPQLSDPARRELPHLHQ